MRRKRVYEDGLIDFNQSVILIDRLIRATTNPFPGAYTFYKRNPITIWKSELNNKGAIYNNKNTGEIISIDKDKILVKCMDGEIWLYDFTDVNGNNFTEFEIGEFLG